MAAFLLAAVAGACFGAMTVAVRTGLSRAGGTTLAPLVTAVVATALVALAALATGDLAQSTLGELWPFAAIGAGVPGLSQIAFFHAIRHAGPSRAAVIIGTTPVISAALAVAFLDESLGVALGLSTLLIVGGGALLAFEGSRPADFRMIGAVLALGCAGLFAIRDNLVRYVVTDENVPPLGAATASLAGAALALLVALLVSGQARELDRRIGRTATAFLPAALLLAGAYVALLEALERGAVTVVAPINATQSLWGVVISALMLRKTEMISRRLVVASVLVVAGSAVIGATR